MVSPNRISKARCYADFIKKIPLLLGNQKGMSSLFSKPTGILITCSINSGSVCWLMNSFFHTCKVRSISCETVVSRGNLINPSGTLNPGIVGIHGSPMALTFSPDPILHHSPALTGDLVAHRLCQI
ncbi:hypothetical protein Droror1_Dr00000097 [Drosera rotundifolia]